MTQNLASREENPKTLPLEAQCSCGFQIMLDLRVNGEYVQVPARGEHHVCPQGKRGQWAVWYSKPGQT